MKKIFTLLTALVLSVMSANAAIYIVGNDPFGGWDPANGVEMTAVGDGTYTYTATISGSVWFVFSDGLSSDWDTFNGSYRYGPTTGSDQTIETDTQITTQKQGNGSGSYKFTGTGSEYTFIFDANNLTVKISGDVQVITDHTYTVAGSPADLFNGSTWSQTDTNNDMTDNEDGTYTWSKSGVQLTAQTVEFKVVQDHDWGVAYPSSNYTYTLDQDGYYDVVITFDSSTNNVTATFTLTTGIQGVEADAAAPTVFYNTAGQRVAKNAKGIVIAGGKKMIQR